jgi:hypothetical protein
VPVTYNEDLAQDTPYSGLKAGGFGRHNGKEKNSCSARIEKMKRSALILSLALFLAAVTVSRAAPKKQNDQTAAKSFSGEIMDSACAQMGSHKQMEAKEGAKTARECTLACLKNGSTLVLYNPSTKTTYQLSDQDKAKTYAGEWVRVKGTYDDSSKTITVDTIARSHSASHATPSGNR